MKYLQATSFKLAQIYLYCYWLSSFDDNPADKEHKTSKEQNVQKMAVVAEFCHSRNSTHCRSQKSTGIVKIIVLHSHTNCSSH